MMRLDVSSLRYLLESIESKDRMTVQRLLEYVCRVEDGNPSFPLMDPDGIAAEINLMVDWAEDDSVPVTISATPGRATKKKKGR